MTGEEMRLIKSSQRTNFKRPGGVIRDVEGCFFHFDRRLENRERFYWICVEWHKSKCQARITTDVACIITKDDLNSHPKHFASAAQVEAVKVKAGMKQQAVETMDPTSAVVLNIKREMSKQANTRSKTSALEATEAGPLGLAPLLNVSPVKRPLSTPTVPSLGSGSKRLRPDLFKMFACFGDAVAATKPTLLEGTFLVHLLRAMASVPIANFDKVWSELVKVMDPRLEPLIKYFEKWYMGTTIARQRGTPWSPQELWNMYDRTSDRVPHTNNSMETYHCSLNTHFGVDHPFRWVACKKHQRYQQKLDANNEDLIA
uniref:FLYWCH-type domain-containing protein n=1 Tax=Plectus sambesii TaxID=2011161 RepID=A0A914XIP0_9BILA